jgi:hypothetical protein
LETPLFLSAINSDNEHFYAILQTYSNKTNIANTYIIIYDVVSKKIDVFSFYLAEKTTINHIMYFEDVFIYTTFSGKSEERIYVFNTKTLATNRLYEHKTSPCEFQNGFLDTTTNSFWLITKFFESKKQNIISLMQLNVHGEIIQNKDIVVNENYYLNSCGMTRIDTQKYLLTGEYACLSKENIFKTRNNNTGIFSVLMTDNEIEDVFYMEYGALEGPFIAEDKKNHLDWHSNTYIAAQTDSIVIVVTDFYKPEYEHNAYPDRTMGYGVWSSPVYVSSETKIAGYRYHLAYFFIYDKSGKMQWYNTFNYNGLMLKNLKNIMRVYVEENTYNTVYYFAFDGNLYSLINNRDKIIQPVNMEKIEPSSQYFSVSANQTSQCEHWYNNCFIYYGYQKLYNRHANNNKSKKNKQVFYVNKLIYN